MVDMKDLDIAKELKGKKQTMQLRDCNNPSIALC
tara:strand:+ start:1145 stop:1246 length:102 start_codon:yes stop_codon:yes gene_type:complete